MSGRPRKAGPLGPQVEGYRAWLAQRGYTAGTIQNMLADLAQVGRWLAVEGLEARQANEELMAAFLAARREAGQRRVPGIRGRFHHHPGHPQLAQPVGHHQQRAGHRRVGRDEVPPVARSVGYLAAAGSGSAAAAAG